MSELPTIGKTGEPVPILVVDDRQENLTVMESVLDSADYRLVLVKSAHEAFLALLNAEFAVVLLDVRMPQLDGYALAGIIHERTASRHLPIIFVSAHRTDPKDEKLGYLAGGVDFITKPFDSGVLRAKVAVFAALYRQRQALAAEVATLRAENTRLRHDLETRELEAARRPVAKIRT